MSEEYRFCKRKILVGWTIPEKLKQIQENIIYEKGKSQLGEPFFHYFYEGMCDNKALGAIIALGVISTQGDILICGDNKALDVIRAQGDIIALSVVNTQDNNITQGANNTQTDITF